MRAVHLLIRGLALLLILPGCPLGQPPSKDNSPPLSTDGGSSVSPSGGTSQPPTSQPATVPPPANDSCASAIPVAEGTFNFDSSGATTDGTTEPACASGNDNQVGADIWYCYTPSQEGTATVSLCGSSFNTKLAIYAGCTCPSSSGTALVCDNDSCGAGGASQASFSVSTGKSYLIRIGGAADANGVPASGAGTLAISLLPAPANDDCPQSISVIEGTHPFSTHGARTDGPSEPACASGNDSQMGADIWYCYSPSTTGMATVSLCGSSFNTKLAVYAGCTCPKQSGTAMMCNDNGCPSGTGSELTFAASVGQTYLIRIGGVTKNGVPATGDGTMTISLTANDGCANALPVAEGVFPFDTRNATTDGPQESVCATIPTDPQISKDIWYCYSPTKTGTVTFSLCGSSFNTKMAVYRGCGCPTGNDTAAICNDDGCGSPGGASQVRLTVTAGQSYMVRVGGATDIRGAVASGPGVLRIIYDGLPDLTFVASAAQPKIVTQTIAAGDCAINEGCTQLGTRKLLVFTAETANIGTADLALGDPGNNSLFYFDTCHGHYHLTAYADYLLMSPTGQVATGRKFGFCLADDKNNNGSPTPFYSCTNQGLQHGWSDIYSSTLPCQYIDVTSVPPGSYTLRLVANAKHILPESDYTNNAVDIPVTIP